MLIYIPTYNHEKTIYSLLSNLSKFNKLKNILIIDDCSNDKTIFEIFRFLKNNNTLNITLLKTNNNYGYSISQKIAYQFLLKKTDFKNILMLHGDGQYEVRLIKFILDKHTYSNYIVQGYRDKRIFKNKDQTPIFSYIIIKILNFYANLLLGVDYKEWHSGFVKYPRNFLKKICFKNLINNMHIDGNFLFVAKLLNYPVISIPIYKLYSKDNKYNLFKMFIYVLVVCFSPLIFIKNKKKYLKNKLDNNYLNYVKRIDNPN